MNTSYKIYTITNAGATITLDEQYPLYIIQGTANALAAGIVITAAVPTTPVSYKVLYAAQATYTGANVVTPFGTPLTAEQALNVCLIEVAYDFVAGAWVASICDGFVSDPYEGIVSTPVILGGTTVTLTKNSKQWQRFTGGGILTGDQSVTWSGTFRDGQIFFLQWSAPSTKGAATVSLAGQSLTTDQVAVAGCTVIAVYDLASTTFRTQIIGNPVQFSGWSDSWVIPVGFSATTQCNNSFVAPCNGTITQLDSYVTTALTNTDAGTVTAKINGVAVTTGVLTIPLSSALDTHNSATPSGANTFVTGDVISLVSAKTTPNGAALVTVRYLKTP